MQKRDIAILGGSPAFDAQEVHAQWPVYGEEEEHALREVLKSRVWCRLRDKHWREGVTGQFEREFGDYLKADHFLAVANGTLAIELALAALDVGRGDEVLVQAGTFFGTVTPILRRGAVPVFLDLEDVNFTVDPAKIEEGITPRTKALIVVHLSGLPADMLAIKRICQERSLALIEDCAQAVGTLYQGRYLGTLGDVGTFSFQQDKQLNSGEGGGVVCRDPKVAERVFAFHQGFAVHGSPQPARHEIGANMRISCWQAAVLRAQLKRLDEQISRRIENARRLFNLLGERGVVSPLPVAAGAERWSMYSCPFEFHASRVGGVSVKTFMAALRAEGIPAFDGHVDPLYRRPLFLDNDIEYRNGRCLVTERIADEHYIAVSQRLFLGPRAWMERLAEVIDDLKRSAAELKAWEAARGDR